MADSERPKALQQQNDENSGGTASTATVPSPTINSIIPGSIIDPEALFMKSQDNCCSTLLKEIPDNDEMTMTRRIPLSEVARHNSAESIWIILDNKVYDVTEFIMEHPGGSVVLLDRAGEDCTFDFDDLGHSAMARQLRETYCIGELGKEDWKKEFGEGHADTLGYSRYKPVSQRCDIPADDVEPETHWTQE